MSFRRPLIRNRLLWVLLAAAAVLIALFLTLRPSPSDTVKAAARTEKALGRRMQSLEGFISTALDAEQEWIGNLGLPDDMVIYRYIEDSLQSWCNQFPVKNDDITGKMVIQKLSRPRENISSPLAEVREVPSFVNYGPKWYIVKSESRGSAMVIAGLEILDTMDEDNFVGINRKIGPGRGFSIVPLSETGGSVVRLGGKAVFKVVQESIGGQTSLFSPALLSKLFSPNVYADGKVFNSLGAVLTASLLLIIGLCCLFSFRKKILRRILDSRHPRFLLIVHCICLFLLLTGVLVYIHLIFRSIIINSGITLELYRLSELNAYSLLVYLMLTALLMTVPLLFVMITPVLKRLSDVRLDILSRTSRILMAVIFAAYLVSTAGILGFNKERDRVNVLANRLSMERNISLELQLRLVEEKIATDQLIGTLTALDNSNGIILNRIVESYMVGLSQDNDIIVELFPENLKDPAALAYFTRMVTGGSTIAEGTRFRYRRDAGGHSLYTGNFAYYNPGSGVTMMLLTVSPKSNREDRGYASILGYTAPGDVLLPSKYSYAKYASDKLVSYKGNYAYPTLMDQERKSELMGAGAGFVRLNGYTHFVNNVSDDDFILISRQKTEGFYYFVAFLFLTLVFYFCLTILTLFRDRKKDKERNYYKSRINASMMVALVMTLITLAAVSVLFVYRRNNANLKYSMAEKTNSIQTLLETRCRFAQDYMDLNTQEAAAALEDVSSTMKCDITLYTTGGKEFRSTTPEVFDRMLLGTRMNQDAFENIIYKNRRYYIGQETIGPKLTYFLYAPVFNGQGKMIAIMSAPFTDESFDFKSEAVLHSLTVVTVFLILLLLARLLMGRAVDKMIKPITEVGRKMNEVDINNLEYIVYERDDEVSTLVRAYNLMVHDLYNSTQKLTQAERD